MAAPRENNHWPLRVAHTYRGMAAPLGEARCRRARRYCRRGYGTAVLACIIAWKEHARGRNRSEAIQSSFPADEHVRQIRDRAVLLGDHGLDARRHAVVDRVQLDRAEAALFDLR